MTGWPAVREARPTPAYAPILRSGWICAVLLLATGVLVMALTYGGGAPQPVIAGLPDPGKLTGWGLPLLRLGADLASFATIGLALAVAWLLPEAHRLVRARSALRTTATAWALLVAGEVVLTLSDVVAKPAADVLGPAGLARFVTRNDSGGRALGVQLALALAVAISAAWIRHRWGALVLLVLSLGAIAPQAFTGHTMAPAHHLLAVTSLLLHVLSASLWVGGLAALAWAGSGGAHGLSAAVPRFSTLAAWCFTAVAVSGLITAAVHLGSLGALFLTGYGALVLGKAAALGVPTQGRTGTAPAGQCPKRAG